MSEEYTVQIEEAEKTVKRILAEYSIITEYLIEEGPILKVKFLTYSQFIKFLPNLDDFPNKVNNVMIIYTFL